MKKIIISLILIFFLIMPAAVLAQTAKQNKCDAMCQKNANSLYGPAPADATAKADYYAQCYANCLSAPITSKEDITNLIITVTNWFAAIVFAIAVIMIIYGGVLYITAAGSEDKAKTAKKLLIYACIGIAVAILAFGAQALISSFLSMGQLK